MERAEAKRSVPSVRLTCDLCAGVDLRPLFKLASRRFYNSSNSLRDEYTICRCSSCELVQVLELPTEDELKDIYGEGYYSGRDDVGYRKYGEANETAAERAAAWLSGLRARAGRALRSPRKLLRLIKRPAAQRPWPYDQLDKVEALASAGSLLDVGCAMGNFLAAARQSGWHVKGVEFSDHSSRVARGRGLDVFTGSLEDAGRVGFVQPGSFEVVTMWDTAEHLPNVMAVFRQCWAALKPGGLLFVETLNIDGDRARSEGEGWHFFRPPKHLIYFGEATLKRYFRQVGYEIVSDANFRHDIVTLAGRKLA